MNTTTRGFFTPLILIAILLVLGGGAYYYTQNSKVSPSTQTEEYSASITSGFEGDVDKIDYKFNYPDTVSIEAQQENQILVLTDTATGETGRVVISNESGRGYSVMDKFNENIKRSCQNCAIVPNEISVKGSSEFLTVIGSEREWIIFSSGPWLVTFEFPRGNQIFKQILSSFTFEISSV